MPEPVAWVALFDQRPNTYLMTDQGTIHRFRSLEDALAYFGDGYGEAHERGTERSMSAVMHWLTFQPLVVPLHAEKQLQDWLDSDENGKVVEVAHYAVCGRMTGIKIKDSVVEELKKMGTAVALVKDEYKLSDIF